MRLALAADREARADRDHHAVVLRMLARRFRSFSEDERLEIYHDAWERMLRKQRDGEQIHSPRRYLLETSYQEALHVATRRDRAEVAVAPNSRVLAELEDEGESIEERVVILDEARIARELIATLESRQRSVFKLRWDLGLEAREVRVSIERSQTPIEYLPPSNWAMTWVTNETVAAAGRCPVIPARICRIFCSVIVVASLLALGSDPSAALPSPVGLVVGLVDLPDPLQQPLVGDLSGRPVAGSAVVVGGRRHTPKVRQMMGSTPKRPRYASM